MRTVVTGGSGFIGTHLVRMLLEAGHEVVILDREPSARFNKLVWRGDVRRLEEVVAAVESAETIYHLAAEHSDDVDPPSLYYDVNVEGTANVVRAAEAHGIAKIVFTSSSAVYGLDAVEPDEESPPAPFNEYGKSKLEAERVLRSWADRTGGSLLIVRPSAVFGEGGRGNVARLIEAISRNTFVMVGRGRNRKSLCYVDNLAAFLAAAAGGKLEYTVVNYADKPDLSMDELVSLLRAETGKNGYMRRIPYKPGLLAGYAGDALSILLRRSLRVSSNRVKKFSATTRMSTARLEEMDFNPLCSLQEGLKRTIRELSGS